MPRGFGFTRTGRNAADNSRAKRRQPSRFCRLPLDASDTHEYVNHRLKQASAGDSVVFGPELTGAIHERSGGLPRLINVICDAVLMAGYGEDAEAITAPLLATVIRELVESGQLGSRTPGRRPWARAAVHWHRPQAAQRS